MNDHLYEQSTSFGMGTVITHKVFGEQAGAALKAGEAETVRLDRMLSRFIPQSEISRINSSAGIKAEQVSSETFEVLSGASEFSKCSQGCFDVTIGPLTALWYESRETLNLPSASNMKKALHMVDYKDLTLDDRNRAVKLKHVGQSIDLGGIGKGFAADKIIATFKKHGVLSAYTNFGGNVATIGTRPDGSLWQVGIQHPRLEGEIIGVVSVENQSVVTSGDYQRYFIGRDGRRYHHILNPVTGYPSESGLISVTLIADNSMMADALSTILFITGLERGIELLKSFPGAEAIMSDTNESIYITHGLKGRFQPCANVELRMIH